tara:strand:+ start:42 stop:611 length:570 start_codon:yes stop_codon:yes gene_type:complete
MLDRDKLKKNLIENFTGVRENVATDQSSAEGFAKAIVDYAKDAEVQITAPFATTTPIPSPDPSVVGKKIKVNTATLTPGQTAMVTQMMMSFKLMDPSMSLISASVATFAALMTTFSNTLKTVNAVGTTVMSVPPPFAPSTKKGMDGGTIEQVCDVMSKSIHTSFTTSIFTGAGTNTAPPAAGPVVGKIV